MSSEHDDHEAPGDPQVPGTGADDDILVGGSAGETPRNAAPRRRLTVVLVAAAVLAAAGGGAYWAVSADGGGKPAGTHTAPVATAPGKDVTVPGTATGSGGDYRLTSTLPTDGPKSAPLYRPSGGVEQAAVGRLAALLGLTGPVVADRGSWRVGSADGTGPALLVSKDAPGTWSYARNGQVTPGARTVVPPALPQVPPPSAAGGASEPDAGSASDPASGSVSGSTAHRAGGSTPDAGSVSGSASGSASGSTAHRAGGSTPDAGSVSGSASGSTAHRAGGSTPDAGGPPVPEPQAKAVVAPVLDGLGLSGARVDATRTAGPTRTVAADPVVGGLPTHGWDTAFGVGADGRITTGHGRLSALAKGDSYPVISAKQAFKDLSARWVMQPDHRKSCQVPMPDKGRAQPADPGGNAAGPAVSPTSPGQDRTLPTSLPCVAPRVAPIDITGARFGLTLRFVPGGQALVPAWLFDAKREGSATGSVIAQQAVEQSDLQGGGSGGNSPGGPSPVSPATRSAAVSAYQPNGNSLTLTFWGGICETYKASAVETPDQVRVTVTGTPKGPGTVCPAIIKAQTTSVPLGAPLGSRTVVDGSTGSPVKAS